MRIRLLGTAAAEGWPAVFCGCEACSKAREAGGKNVRSRSGALIDDDLKIDLAPDTYMHALRDRLDLSRVRHLLITHTHQDHYYYQELGMYFPPFAHDNGELHIWGDEWAIQSIEKQFPNWPHPHWLHTLAAYEKADLEGTAVLPLRAAHYPSRGAFNYVIRRGGKTLLYGLDSAWFPDDSWQAQRQFRFDAVVLDCTHGPLPGGSVHGGTDTVIATKERMLSDGTATPDTRFIATHFSHNGGMLHDDLVALFQPHGIEVAFDGMEIQL